MVQANGASHRVCLQSHLSVVESPLRRGVRSFLHSTFDIVTFTIAATPVHAHIFYSRLQLECGVCGRGTGRVIARTT